MNFDHDELRSELRTAILEFAKEFIQDSDLYINYLKGTLNYALTNADKICHVNFSDFGEFAAINYGLKLKRNLDSIDNLILNIYGNPNNLRFIDGYEFEDLVKRLFSYYDFNVNSTKRTRDGGFDLVAVKEGMFPVKYLIECKTTSLKKRIGIEAVRSLMHVVNEENATAGVLISNYEFSKVSINSALLKRFKFVLIDFYKVINMISDYVTNLFFYKKSISI